MWVSSSDGKYINNFGGQEVEEKLTYLSDEVSCVMVSICEMRINIDNGLVPWPYNTSH